MRLKTLTLSETEIEQIKKELTQCDKEGRRFYFFGFCRGLIGMPKNEAYDIIHEVINIITEIEQK